MPGSCWCSVFTDFARSNTGHRCPRWPTRTSFPLPGRTAVDESACRRTPDLACCDPLAVGDASAEEVAEVLERVWGGDETLIVVSSDLSHYLNYDAACLTDSRAARQILDLDPPLNHHQACGATPINGLLLAARHHKLHGKLLDLRNSGGTARDKARVVGYGACAFIESRPGGHPHAR